MMGLAVQLARTSTVQRETYEELIQMTLPQPPNLSFPQPYTTLPIPICRNAEAHMTQGSTVTYRVIAVKGAGFVGNKWSIASSSACSVAYISAYRSTLSSHCAIRLFGSSPLL